MKLHAAALCLLLTPSAPLFAALTCTPSVQWTWDGATRDPAFPGPRGTPLVAQFTDDNGDGRVDVLDTPDVVFLHCGSTGCVISVLDGQSGTPHFTVNSPKVTNKPIAVADIDGDGAVEIIAGHSDNQRLVALDSAGTVKWTSDFINPNWPFFGLPGVIGVADLDQNGTADIYVGLTVLNNDGTLRWQSTLPPPGSGLLSAAVDLLPARPGLELLSARWLLDSAGNSIWAGPLGDGSIAVGDLDGDGDAEIVLARRSSEVYLLDHLGTVLAPPVALPGVGLPIVADLDGDGQAEVVAAGSAEVLALEWDGSALMVKWQVPSFDPSTGGPLTSYDFDGDGASEVLYHDQRDWFVIDGRSGALLVREPFLSDTGYELIVVADIDNDCRPEILVSGTTGSPYPGQLIAYECDGVPPRRIWNQALYHVTNINDDGTIPQFEVSPWTAQNSWLGQTKAPRGIGPVADAGPPITLCPGDSARLDGSASLPCDASGLEYRWLEGAIPICNWSTSPTCDVVPGTTTAYALEVRCLSHDTCNVGATVTITVAPRPVARASGTNLVCVGSPTTLDGAGSAGCPGAMEYRWLDGATPLCNWSTTSTCNVMPATATTYTLEVRCQGGMCEATASHPVDVAPRPVARVSPDQNVCALAPVQLDAATSTTSGCPGGALYEWWQSATLVRPASPVATYSPPTTLPGTLTYTVVVSCAGLTACDANATVDVTVRDCSLAVQFDAVSASRVDRNRVQVRWRTSSEVGAVLFAVERATSLSGPFTMVGTTPAQGSGASYAFLDQFETATPSLFYRVVEHTASGRGDESPVVSPGTLENEGRGGRARRRVQRR